MIRTLYAVAKQKLDYAFLRCIHVKMLWFVSSLRLHFRSDSVTCFTDFPLHFMMDSNNDVLALLLTLLYCIWEHEDNVVFKDLQPDLTRDIKRSSLLLAPPDLCYVLLMDGGLLASTCACIKVNLDAFVIEPLVAGFGFIFVIMRVSFLLQLLFPLSRCWPL